MSEIVWPDKPTCHGDVTQGVFKISEPHWRPTSDTCRYRTCSYCGSIHPADLITEIQSGNAMGGSDWKYGYPHKFYLREPFGKFYSDHLLDAGYSEEAMTLITALLLQHTDIEFKVMDGKLGYKAPTPGHQR